MRYRLAQVVVLAWAPLLVGQYVCAQASPEIQTGIACSSSSEANDQQSSGPEITIAGVTFSGFLQMPVPDQEEIAASIKEQTYRASLDQATNELLEIARNGWQNRGYIKVKTNGYATTLDSTLAAWRIALSVHVDEGLRYSLGGITFKNNRAVSGEALRGVFPIEDGDIFNRKKIMTGLENLRKAYGQLGYINFTSIADPRFDDEKQLIYLDIDMSEGKQFYVGTIDILGLDDTARTQMLQDFLLQPGQVYNQRLVELSMPKHGSVLPNCECGDRPSLWLDEKTAIVKLTFDFRPCLGTH